MCFVGRVRCVQETGYQRRVHGRIQFSNQKIFEDIEYFRMLHKNIYEAFDEGQPNPKKSTKRSNKKPKEPLPDIIQGAQKVVEKPKKDQVKQPQKPKGVSAEPHPLDRRSGTGMGKEPKKQGGGGMNWGTYKDELKMEDSADKHDLFKDSPQKESKEEEKAQKTLDEYYGQQQWVVVGSKGQQNDKEEQIKKELEIEKMAKEEHLEIVEKKGEEQEAKAPKKKKRNKKKKQAA
eukprot:TRINITY_DN3952_c0_g2_i12.p1 TRINITY_DN3952_c0_g2~~TRINITY_DN3952_c0_g2_i12.p1  ORF type:complete len:233 (-),score=56.98 TRINITY_DN3952_c0_g2_i12:105-803(-)